MKRWIRLAARIYPRSWRERYGAEFQALLDDVKPGWRDFIDITRGALIMRLTADRAYLKLGCAVALAGALMAGGLSMATPDRYVSAAVLRLTPGDRLEQIRFEVLSRHSLIEIIQRPALNLYHKERQREPMEDIVERMRRDIQILPLGGTPDKLAISFIYSDKEKAQAVTRALVTRMTEANANQARYRAIVWREVEALRSVPMPPGDNIEVLDSPSLPAKVSRSNRAAMIASGLGLGFVIGLLAAAVRRRGRWSLQVAGFAAAGCALGAAVAFLIPDTYISSAVMRISRPIVPESLLGPMAPVPMAEWLPRIEAQALRRAGIQNRDIRIEALGPTAFRVSVLSRDRFKAQAVVRLLVTQFTEENRYDERERWRAAHGPQLAGILIDRKLGANLEVLDSASLPEEPASPNRAVIAALGLAAGVIGGTLTLRRRSRDISKSWLVPDS